MDNDSNTLYFIHLNDLNFKHETKLLTRLNFVIKFNFYVISLKHIYILLPTFLTIISRFNYKQLMF